MKYLALFFGLFICTYNSGDDTFINSKNGDYIDRIAIIRIILEDNSPLTKQNHKGPVNIGLHDRFESIKLFEKTSCRDLGWGVAYCDLFNIVRFYNKTRFLTTRWFDFGNKAKIYLMDRPNFERVEIFFHFSQIAINYTGEKGLVMVRIDTDENNSEAFIFALEKKNDWRILHQYTLN